MKNGIEISVVAPAYKCSRSIKDLFDKLCTTLEEITDSFEIIFVNDCSPENDWQIIKEIAEQDKRVKGVNLSKNFGQHCAITAGLDYARGNWVIVMDCDLQDNPAEIRKLYDKALEGYDVVVGKRQERKDSFAVKISSKVFYIVFNYLTEQEIDNKVANFGIYSKKVIDNVRKFKEKDRSFGLLVTLVGFSRTEIDVKHSGRVTGDSAYSFKSRLNLAIDHILSHSNKPLILAIQAGSLISVFSTLYALWLIVKYFIYANTADGWTSLMVSLFFLSGLIIMVIGIVGLYVGKIYNEVKGRPLYIVNDVVN